VRTPDELAREGEPIVRAQRIEIMRTLTTAHPVSIGEQRVEAVNAQQNRSHLGHELAKRAAFGVPIGLVYRVMGRTVDASIYSIGDVDVSEIAQRFGGGGHRNASGFSVSLRRWLEEFC
jgi:nanoRNase/pAp phosphatase (c-di-AMP/oligoRNAs hydrolase)